MDRSASQGTFEEETEYVHATKIKQNIKGGIQ